MRGLTGATWYPEQYSTPYGSEGLYLQNEYAVEVDDPRCPVLLEIHVEVIDGRPECVELRCRQRPGGPPVSSERLRQVALRRYLRESTRLYSDLVLPELVQATGTGDELILARAEQESRRRAQPITDEHLAEVAEVYSAAGSKPTQAVLHRFHVSRPTASRWVRLARDRGFLPEPVAKPRKP
jgi:hypothetical protein